MKIGCPAAERNESPDGSKGCLRAEPFAGLADQIVVERDQILSGISPISNPGAWFEAPETISGQGRFEDVLRGGYDPAQHLKDLALDG